jgi:hypothetical protein
MLGQKLNQRTFRKLDFSVFKKDKLDFTCLGSLDKANLHQNYFLKRKVLIKYHLER